MMVTVVVENVDVELIDSYFIHDHFHDESDSESRLVLVTRMAMYTRSIDSNLERGRYISRVGRASSFLSLTR
jgi:hypothetical protein